MVDFEATNDPCRLLPPLSGTPPPHAVQSSHKPINLYCLPSSERFNLVSHHDLNVWCFGFINLTAPVSPVLIHANMR